MLAQILIARRRLLLLVGALLVAGFLATSLASYYVSRASVRGSIIESGLPLTSDNVYSEIQKDLLQPIFIASMMAHDTFLRDWVLDGEGDMSRIARYLGEIKDKYSTVASFFVSDATRNYYYPDGVLKKVDPTSWRDVWYFRVRDMAAPYEINVDPDLANGDALTIFINYRVLNYDGAYIGVTGVGLTVSALRARMDSYRNRFGRSVYFVDSAGKIMLAPGGVAARETIMRDPGLAAIARAILEGKGGTFEYERDGQDVLLHTRFIPELGWHLFVEQEEGAALAGLRHTLIANLLICLVITVVVVTATGYTIRLFQARIEMMAASDKLTGLLNRHGFEVVFEQALKEARRTREPLSIILFDIDRFKSINDRVGHLAGDAVIRHVGRAARTAVREADVLCRWGGDEFLVLLKNCSRDAASRTAAKIGERVHGSEAEHGGRSIDVTVSLGVTEYRPGEEVDQFLSRADAALSDAKTSGRQRVVAA